MDIVLMVCIGQLLSMIVEKVNRNEQSSIRDALVIVGISDWRSVRMTLTLGISVI